MNSQKLTLIGAAVFALLFIIVLFLFALNGRYHIEGTRVFDKCNNDHYFAVPVLKEAQTISQEKDPVIDWYVL